MSVFQWIKQDLYHTQIALSNYKQQEENGIQQEVKELPKLSKDLTTLITRMQQNLGMRIEYGPLDNVAEVPVEKPAVIRTNNSTEIKLLEDFFSNCSIPSTPMSLNKGETILNGRAFIQSHLSVLKNYSTNKYFLPYLERLQKLKMYLQQIN